MSEKVNRREQVKELIETGEYTKAEIAAKLEVKDASVSSQMTYLRWMGHFIVADENKKLRFCTEDEYNAQQEVVLANRKAKASTSAKTPQEQADALAKTLKTQRAAYAKAQAKVDQVNADIAEDPDDEELVELKEEADANATLLRIKIKRNEAAAAKLPEPNVVADVPEDDTDPDGDDELL